MWTVRRCLMCLVIFLSVGVVSVGAKDLRKQYGTRSLEAANRLNRAITLSNERKPAQALREVEAAIKADPDMQMAHYWKSLILKDLGDIDKSIEASKRCISLDPPNISTLTIDACLNLALTFANLDRHDEANVWFSRAVLEDPRDHCKMAWKAYRNLAISLKAQGRHLAAAGAVSLAYEADPTKVQEKMVLDFMKQIGECEAGQVLHIEHKLPELKQREVPMALTPVALEGEPLSEHVTQLLPDPQGAYVVALVRNAHHCYRVQTGETVTVHKVEIGQRVQCGCLTEGRLYVVCADPGRLFEIDPASGEVTAQFDLQGRGGTSIAVFPSHGVAYLPGKETVCGLSMETGKFFETDIPGQYVAADPAQKLLYSYVKDTPSRPSRGHVIINGRPVILHNRNVNWTQTHLFTSVVIKNGLLLAGCRVNAASNGRKIVTSPDGHWMGVLGGGGWRPQGTTAQGGYGILVCETHNLEHVQGFFRSAGYPRGMAFNPVTGQVVAVADKEMRITDIADRKDHTSMKGNFSGACAWSGGGDFLLLALKKNKGIQAYANTLSSAEVKVADLWWKGLIPEGKASAREPVTKLPPVRMIARFKVQNSWAVAKGSITRAIKAGSSDRPLHWRRYQPYIRHAEVMKTLTSVTPHLKKHDGIGIAIYRLNGLLKKHPESIPAKTYLGQGLERSGQTEKARALYEQVIREDAGRTNLSLLALNGLGRLYQSKGQPLSAIYCFGLALYMDKGNTEALALVVPLLKSNRLQQEARLLGRTGSTAVAHAVTLPKLMRPPYNRITYSPDRLYRRAVNSVVLVRSGQQFGTGFCVGKRGIILTNMHVVDGARSVEVTPFSYAGNTLRRMTSISARIIFGSRDYDVAVLQMDEAPQSMIPLVVTTKNPQTGKMVYAIGNPGLGHRILEQSITNGIISSSNRTIQGKTYLQHTAAINPGNSGGPLLNEQCQVVGMITLKASLENVSFAIPAETIRQIFNSP